MQLTSLLCTATLGLLSVLLLTAFQKANAQSAAGAACSNASVNGVYGFLDSGTDASGTPAATLWRARFNPSTGKFTGTSTTNQNGLIETGFITGTYAVASNCAVTGTITDHLHKTTHSFFGVVTSTGGVQVVSGKTGTTNGGFLLPRGSPTCTNAGATGRFGLEARGNFVAGAPFVGPVVLIGELVLRVNSSGDGLISGHIAGSEDGTILPFAEEPVTGSYSVDANCIGTASITLNGNSELNFSLVVVGGGNQMLAIEMDANTVVTATLQR